MSAHRALTRSTATHRLPRAFTSPSRRSARGFSQPLPFPFSSPRRSFCSAESAKTVKMTFVLQDKSERVVTAACGDTLLNVCQDNEFDVEGACGGTCCCSTCHVYLEQSLYDKLGEPEEDEDDLLDNAVQVEKTSRLGCQVEITEEFDGSTIRLPETTINQMEAD